jgi:hypothetical protein
VLDADPVELPRDPTKSVFADEALLGPNDLDAMGETGGGLIGGTTPLPTDDSEEEEPWL